MSNTTVAIAVSYLRRGIRVARWMFICTDRRWLLVKGTLLSTRTHIHTSKRKGHDDDSECGAFRRSRLRGQILYFIIWMNILELLYTLTPVGCYSDFSAVQRSGVADRLAARVYRAMRSGDVLGPCPPPTS
jgi:hypothetical protein